MEKQTKRLYESHTEKRGPNEKNPQPQSRIKNYCSKQLSVSSFQS